MIEPIECIKDIKGVDEPAIKLSPRDGIPNKIPDLAQNEEMVLESIKNGCITLVGILLETGFNKDLFDIENEVYDVQKELGLLGFEISISICQRELITEYTDKMCNSEHPRQLKDQLVENLSKLIEDKVQEAVEQDIREERIIKGQFRLYKAPDIVPLKIKAEYLQHFLQLSISFESIKISDVQESLKVKIAALRKKREGVSCNLDELRLIKREIDNVYFEFNNEQIEIYQGAIKRPGTFKVPPLYVVNKNTMEKILEHRVSPNLVDPETGETLLHIALAEQHLQMVELLMTRGADPLKTNRKGISAMKIASNMEDPRFLAVITAALKKSDFLCDQLRRSYTGGLKVFLTELPQAKVILDSYADTLVSRLSLLKIIRIILFIESRIDSRTKDFDIYYRKLKDACEVLDPTVFFNEVLKRAENAEKGLFRRSALHDPLLALYANFMKKFDPYAFHQAKEAMLIANAKSACSPLVKRQIEEIKSKKDENISLKVELATLKDELKSLRAEVKNIKECSEKTNRDNSPRRSEDEIRMGELPTKAGTVQSFFKP